MKFLPTIVITVLLIFSGFLGYGIYKQKASNRPLQKTTPAPTNFTPVVFSYDVTKAKTLLTKFLKDNIKPQFIPQNIEIKQGQQIDGKESKLGYEFNSRFILQNDTFSFDFNYNKNSNNLNGMQVFIQPSSVKKTTLTANLANSLVTTYFINPQNSITDCKTKTTTTYCETFDTKENGKKGYGVISTYDGPKLINIVFTCFFAKEGNLYSSQQSCLRL